MHSHILAAVASNPASNWVGQWKAGWDSTPAASAQTGAANSGLIMIALVAVIVLVIWASLKRLAS
jgi:hypothetical protein